MSNDKECCKIEAVVTLDGKGQIVLPKDLREKAGLSSGDKLAMVAFEREGAVCCFVMVRTKVLRSTVKNMLGSIFEGSLR
jgi:antitoxin PrlF